MARHATHPRRVRRKTPGRRRRGVMIRHRLQRLGGVLAVVLHRRHSTHH
jgi:hypothetical protein